MPHRKVQKSSIRSANDEAERFPLFAGIRETEPPDIESAEKEEQNDERRTIEADDRTIPGPDASGRAVREDQK
ncbi:MAG: hypothetical protein ACREBD_24995, partial [Blastocatellia bacterium]